MISPNLVAVLLLTLLTGDSPIPSAAIPHPHDFAILEDACLSEVTAESWGLCGDCGNGQDFLRDGTTLSLSTTCDRSNFKSTQPSNTYGCARNWRLMLQVHLA